MLKKTAVIVITVVVIISCCCIPASAASVTAGTATHVYVGDDLIHGNVLEGGANADGSYWINYYQDRTSYVLGLLYPVSMLVNRGDTVTWGGFDVHFYFSLDSTVTDSVALGFMDEYYGFYQLEHNYPYGSSYYGTFDAKFEGGSKQFSQDVNVKYMCIMLFGYYGQPNAGTFAWRPYTFKLSSMDENSIRLEGVIAEQEKTNEKLDDLNSNQQQTNEKLDDLLKQPEQEKQEAGGSGNDAVDGLLGAIPADNEGIINSLRKLSDSMSYTGTECTWTFPALYIPKIEGVTERIPLTDEMPIDFRQWIWSMPVNIKQTIQYILTIALILYCCKELYSLIKYVLTMKGGGGGNE